MKNSLIMPVIHSGSEKRTTRLSNLYNSLLIEFKQQQTGYSALAIIGQSCIGSVAVMLLLMNDMSTAVKLTFVFLVTSFCMAFNAAVLAQLSSRVTFNLLIMSVLFSAVIIIVHLV